MAEGLTEPPSSSSKGPADVASATVTGANTLLSNRIDFHLERNPFSPISSAESQKFRLETLNPSSAQPERSPAMSSAGPSNLGKKSDCESDSLFKFRITFRRIGAGLENLGNTCYLNSVLQCLTYTEPFAAYCQSGEHKSSCRTAGFCAMCALQSHVMNALRSTGKILSPYHLVKNLRCISRNFSNSRQEDAHEYMVNLLESMHKCCLPSGVPSESSSAYEKSLVHKIFGGRLRSQVKCTQCGSCYDKFEPFLDLSLEILKADSLWEAFVHFTSVEYLDGGERQYQCGHCKEKVRARKQLTVHKAPHVLTIHLKRFGPDIYGEKIDKKVDFEPTLDLQPFISDQQDVNLKYTLYGVLVHAGWSTHSGHYYCFVRTSSAIWHSLDDNEVRPVSEKTVLAQEAYMLFYVRDRTSTVNRAVDVDFNKVKMPANIAPVSKAVPQLHSKINEAIEKAKKKSRISEDNSAKSKADDASHSQPEAAFTPKNINAILIESATLQNIDLQENGEILSDGLHQTTPLKDSMELENPLEETPLLPKSSQNQQATENLAPSSPIEDNGGITTLLANDASHNYETEQAFQEKSRFHNGCSGHVGLRILAALPLNSGYINLDSEKHNKNHNEGITNGISQNCDIRCKINTNTSANKEPEMILSQVTSIDGCIRKENFETKSEEHQEAVVIAEGEHSNGKCSHIELKRKKLEKQPLKGKYFGRKKLFATSLYLRKKKQKRNKNCHSKHIIEGKILEDIHTDDQGASTSEAIKVVGVTYAGSSKKRLKHSRSRLNKENSLEDVKDEKYCNCDYVQNRNLDGFNKNDAMVATSDQFGSLFDPTEKHCDGKEADAQKGITSLLTSLKEITVPQWDHVGFPSSRSLDSDDAQNNSIGYVLNDWDEEYDRGKKKRAKKSKRPFGGPNPFQEISNTKIHHNRKMNENHFGSRNQPFRI